MQADIIKSFSLTLFVQTLLILMPAPSGHLRNCSVFHYGNVFQQRIKPALFVKQPQITFVVNLHFMDKD